MNTEMKHFSQAEDIAIHIVTEAQNSNRRTTPAEVVSATTAYLIACDRTGRFHDLMDRPMKTFDYSDTTIAQDNAWLALWDVIGEDSMPGDQWQGAAWDVWGVMGNNDVTPGMDANQDYL